MKKQVINGTDLTVSGQCLGTMPFGSATDRKTAYAILDRFYELGGNFIDTANIYGKWMPEGANISERIIGDWKRENGLSDELVLLTKGGHFDLNTPMCPRITETDLRADLEESMDALQADCIDLYLLHRDDENVPVAEIIDLMEELVREGKIRYYGASNFRECRMEEAVAYAKAKGVRGFSVVSNQWSMATDSSASDETRVNGMYHVDESYYKWHERTGMPLLPYSSTAHGAFSKMKQGTLTEQGSAAYVNPRNEKLFALLEEESAEEGVNLYVLAQAYLRKHPFQVIPVAGVSSPVQLSDFVRAAEYEIPDRWMQRYLSLGVW